MSTIINAFNSMGGTTGAGSQATSALGSGSNLYGDATIAGAKLLSGLFEQQVASEEEARRRKQEAFIKGQQMQTAANNDGYTLNRNAFQSIIQNMRGNL